MKPKLGTLKEVAAAAARAFGEEGETHGQTIRFSDRRSAGDAYPPAELRERMESCAATVQAAFNNVTASYDVCDEWYEVTVKVLPHPRYERPVWSNARILAYMEKTIKVDVSRMPQYHKVEHRWMQVANGYPCIFAYRGPKWNNYDCIEFRLTGDCETGWEVIAEFGPARITHKVTTDRGLLQKVWRKLKAAHANYKPINQS